MTTPPAGHRPSLWLPGDIVLLFALNLLGAALVFAAAWATTATDDLSARVGWVNLAVVGSVVAGLGNTFWLLAGRRAVGERRARLLMPAESSGVADTRINGHRPAESVLVALPGGTRYHRPICAFVKGKEVGSGPRSEHDQAGRAPCGVCEP